MYVALCIARLVYVTCACVCMYFAGRMVVVVAVVVSKIYFSAAVFPRSWRRRVGVGIGMVVYVCVSVSP